MESPIFYQDDEVTITAADMTDDQFLRFAHITRKAMEQLEAGDALFREVVGKDPTPPDTSLLDEIEGELKRRGLTELT